MSQYISVFFWIAICAFVTQQINAYHQQLFLNQIVYRIDKVWAILIFLPLVYWAATRPTEIFDTGAYASAYSGMVNSIRDINVYMAEVNKDRGFYFFANLIHIWVGNNVKIYLGIIAIIQALFLVRMLQKYSCDFVLSVFVFVASTDYLSWMHNGIRQFLAVTIILGGTDYIIKKNYVKIIICILIASLFHGSALLMIPVVFIVQGKPWNIRTTALIIFSAIVILYIDQFTALLDDMLSDTQYTNVVSDWQSWNDNGTNPLRVLVYSVPMLLSIVGKRFIDAENNPIINIVVNMSIITTAIYIISMFTSGIFIGRLPVYTSLYATCILLPWEIEHIFTKQSARMVKIGLVAGYLAFYYYQCHISWAII